MNRTSRLNSNEIKIIKQKLIERCDEKYGKIVCEICKQEYPIEKLVLEHIDNNSFNCNLTNLQLACKKCNYEKNPPKFYNLKGKSLDILRVGESCKISKFELSGFEPEPQSAEMKKNRIAEPKFRNWVENKMRKPPMMIKSEDVMYGGAEFCEVSIQTTERYLKKMCSIEGKYKIIKDIEGNKYLAWKTKYSPYKNFKNKYCN